MKFLKILEIVLEQLTTLVAVVFFANTIRFSGWGEIFALGVCATDLSSFFFRNRHSFVHYVSCHRRYLHFHVCLLLPQPSAKLLFAVDCITRCLFLLRDPSLLPILVGHCLRILKTLFCYCFGHYCRNLQAIPHYRFDYHETWFLGEACCVIYFGQTARAILHCFNFCK